MNDLKSKGGIQGIAEKRVDIFMIDPRKLRVEAGWNSRIKDFDPEDAEDEILWRSIAENGVKNPLTAYWKDDAPILTDGHRRLAAAMYAISQGAELASVPVQTEGKHANAEDRILSQITRNSGKPLSVLERATVFKKLIDLGWDEDRIAAKVGCVRQSVVNALGLRAAPVEIVELVKEGTISASLATKVVRESKGDEIEAVKVVKNAVATAKTAGKDKATAKHLKPQKAAPGDLTRTPGYALGIQRCIEIAKGELTHIDAAILIEMFEDELDAE